LLDNIFENVLTWTQGCQPYPILTFCTPRKFVPHLGVFSLHYPIIGNCDTEGAGRHEVIRKFGKARRFLPKSEVKRCFSRENCAETLKSFTSCNSNSCVHVVSFKKIFKLCFIFETRPIFPSEEHDLEHTLPAWARSRQKHENLLNPMRKHIFLKSCKVKLNFCEKAAKRFRFAKNCCILDGGKKLTVAQVRKKCWPPNLGDLGTPLEINENFGFG